MSRFFILLALNIAIFSQPAWAVQTRKAGEKALADHCTGERIKYIGQTEDNEFTFLNCSLRRYFMYSCKDIDREASKDERNIKDVAKEKRYQLAKRALVLRKTYREYCED